MKKLIITFLFILSLALLISCGECTHEWTEATCTEPKTCSLCGITEGEPTNHALGDWVVTAPGCEHDGSKTRSCVCGKESETEEIKALGHDITEHYGKKPSCTEGGYSEYETCSRCAYTTYKELPAAHSYKVTVVAPSCTAVGYTSYVCEKCEHSYTDSETAMLGHSFGEWTTVAASCTADGSMTRKCACGETETEILAKLGHELVDVEAAGATCKATGHNAHKACTRCDYKEGYEEIQKSDHSYTFTVKPYTCTEEGYTTYVCTSCGFRYVSDRTSPAHRFGEWQITPASCEQSGSKTRSCNCGETETETIPATGHSYGDWTTVEPTCEEDGSKTRSCPCGDVETEILPSPGHSIKHHDGKENTCTEPGYKAYDTCDNCNYSTYEVLPAMHKYTSIVTPPTCTERGFTTYTCSVPSCQHSYVDDYIDPVGHSWGTEFISKPITMTEDVGEYRSNCMSCSGYTTRPFEVIMQGNFGMPAGNAGSPTAAAQFKIYEDGTLKVTGTGVTIGTGWDGKQQPYIEHRNIIKKVIIGEGITEISSGNFAYFANLESVEYPSTLKTLKNNAFMASFKSNMTELVIPAQITSIGEFVYGVYKTSTATFSSITIENPNIVFAKPQSLYVFNNGTINTQITFFSYGKSNNVSAYAAAIGARYVDLNDVAEGVSDNVHYKFFEGKLTLKAVNPDLPATLPEDAPWLEKIEKTKIKIIEIERGIQTIPSEYFIDYVALEKVILSSDVISVGNMAFAVNDECSTELSIGFPMNLEYLGINVFINRTNVKLAAYSGTPAEKYTQAGVEVSLTKVFRLLLIGNSLSQDAADMAPKHMENTSQLYNIIKSMLGENSHIEIGTLYSGAKTAAWHATKAYENASVYSFSIIGTTTGGNWKQISINATAEYGLKYTDWDHVTIQPYSMETQTGVAAPSKEQGDTFGHECDERFLPLSESLPYLLDYVNAHAPSADVHYYLIWHSTHLYNQTNVAESQYARKLAIAKEANMHKGASGKGFTSLIPAGTAIQIARSTYFGTLGYGTDDSSKLDTQIGLQRDTPHLSYCIGRYIVGLLFAEMLVPEELREENYVLPDIIDSPTEGKLPKAYTELAQLIVHETLKTVELTGDAQYAAIRLQGYEKDPADKLKDALSSYDFSNMTASDKASLETKILEIAKGLGEADTAVTVKVNEDITPTSSAQSFTATITVRFGYTTRELTVNGSVKLP